MQSNEIASIRWYAAITRFTVRKIFDSDHINALVRDGLVLTKSRNVLWGSVSFTPTMTMSSRLITGNWRSARLSSPRINSCFLSVRDMRVMSHWIVELNCRIPSNIVYTISRNPLNNRTNRESSLNSTLRYFGPYLRRSFSAKCDLLRFFVECRSNS